MYLYKIVFLENYKILRISNELDWKFVYFEFFLVRLLNNIVEIVISSGGRSGVYFDWLE